MKQMVIDFINYGIVAIFFLIIPFTVGRFILLVIMLIYDLIHLFVIERREKNGL